MSIADDVFSVFAAHGDSAYFGESVSMTEHALQTAHFAETADASPALIIAALLHDVGHLVVPVPEDIAEWTHDARHEEIGAAWLAAHFPPEIAGPVRLHVPAKRYLCATDRHYAARLSSASVVTLGLQGGAMAPDEVARFESEPFHADAIKLRRWDDRGKIAGLATRPIREYRAMLERMAGRACASPERPSAD